ncbi:tolB protein precursor protein [Aerosticca soli]|uniref:Tol-Pal system protein TolB n=2 Tax=Aerosticca soli TaxID=2010829 RepID=A0A2Z6E6R3_9GAMM|nr:tolB protein precursor protein [Aerosticca soli]
MRRFGFLSALLLLYGLLSFERAPAQALNVEITGGLKTATPIVVVPFAQSGAPLPTDVADVMRNDFNRCGKFRALARSEIVETPSRGADIKFPTWRLLKQDYIVVGHIDDAGSGMVQVEYELWDVNRQQSLLHQAMPPVPVGDLRGVAHQIADAVYQKITGVRGAFWTRIAYITAVGLGNRATYSLIVADSDGYNPQVVARSRESLLTPRWSPDGSKIAYVSFESGNSQIYIQDITTGARQLVASHPRGINGAPAWSPDGSKLAIALSYVGNPEIFVLDLASRRETRLTNNLAIDTEPVWAPDGQSIYFTSDRSGRPQIYQMPATGGTPTRITFQGQSNYDADVSFDGKQLAMVQGNGNVYRIAVMDLGLDGQVRFLSPGPIDESPKFAPNASMLLYAATEGPRGVLYAVSADGMVRQRLMLADGDVREPAWGPYRQR